ncbi:2-polyprenyl-6-methoxyphenol hydroxylase-like FAD-dependent oxidoreductase [Bacillus tianshenii]|uniref:2-polyprenyl-6-methoxyphenol hydroxylase-like FAD-dependent oxidoreductase n=1 Tax=Sutcliffiella tianshenii TaxID=1463404 RepID=A0ABS2P323_9BACI|nr:FAD-dependent monooxygenase [Bacillus tianshenii]MBM7621261.1 2-polyprenyl-6-methoxyphenol hydroxylase-like FAD-dependent oxidoreductase [Bacillus tianshenii]
MNRKAIVVGAGLGGLSVAIQLKNKGWQVEVFDKATSFKSMGAGIVLAANGMKALERLGVAGEVKISGKKVGKAEIRTWDGKILFQLPTKEMAERYGTYSYLIHRASLQEILLDKFDGAGLHLQKGVSGFLQDESKVTALFTDGSQVEGDVLIGADGIHSAIRANLILNDKLRYAGFTALRGICSFKDEGYGLKSGGGFEAWGPGKRFGFSHLGQDRIFWFAAINAPEGKEIPFGSRKQAALHHLKGWYPPIEAVIQATAEEAILHHDIFDRKPLSQWGSGRVTLLGDAAHPMLPNLGQGGAQAMEDAIVLADCLSNSKDMAEAIFKYERERIRRTTKMVHHSRKMARMMQLENRVAIGFRNLMLQAVPSDILASRLHWVVGHEV